MGKAEAGTPKDIANRMKAKGLQKLRWYCQMCQKQCRDENGFKCHTMSESHQRQLLLFAEDPDKYLDSFSQEFLDGYLSLLKRQFGTKRVHANNVYQEYIHDRDHVHMNATQWETLTDFVKWMGRQGHCTVDETEKGWYVTYIDRDPETIMRQEKMAKKEKFEKDEEERMNEFINRQIEFGKLKQKTEDVAFTELKRETDEALKLNLQVSTSKVKPQIKKNPLSSSVIEKKKDVPLRDKLKKRTALDDIMEEERRVKKNKEAAELQEAIKNKEIVQKNKPWLSKNIIVKVITKDLGSKFYKQKGEVKQVIDEYGAIVKLNECGTKIKLDQSKLETVIPSIGRDVLILNGKYKGEVADLESIQESKFTATLKIKTGNSEGKVITSIPYEDFSKLAV